MIEFKTNEEYRVVQTETLTVKAWPLAGGYVKAKTGNAATAAVYDECKFAQLARKKDFNKF